MSGCAALLDGCERLAEYVFKQKPFAFRFVRGSALGNLAHEGRIAQDIHSLFEPRVFMDIHQDSRRSAILRNDDFLFTLLNSHHKFR